MIDRDYMSSCISQQRDQHINKLYPYRPLAIVNIGRRSFRVDALGFGVHGLGNRDNEMFKILGLGIRDEGLGFRFFSGLGLGIRD